MVFPDDHQLPWGRLGGNLITCECILSVLNNNNLGFIVDHIFIADVKYISRSHPDSSNNQFVYVRCACQKGENWASL